MAKTSSDANQPTDLAAERARTLASIEADIVSSDEAERLVGNYDETTLKAIELRVDLQIKIQKKQRREKWDKTLLRLVIAGFCGSYLMIVLIGLKVLKFDNNAFAVPAVVGAGIIQTYGLAKIAAEYFFSDDKKKKKK